MNSWKKTIPFPLKKILKQDPDSIGPNRWYDGMRRQKRNYGVQTSKHFHQSRVEAYLHEDLQREENPQSSTCQTIVKAPSYQII